MLISLVLVVKLLFGQPDFLLIKVHLIKHLIDQPESSLKIKDPIIIDILGLH